MRLHPYSVTVTLAPTTLSVWAQDESEAKWKVAHMIGGAGLSSAGTFEVTALQREAVSPNIGTAA